MDRPTAHAWPYAPKLRHQVTVKGQTDMSREPDEGHSKAAGDEIAAFNARLLHTVWYTACPCHADILTISNTKWTLIPELVSLWRTFLCQISEQNAALLHVRRTGCIVHHPTHHTSYSDSKEPSTHILHRQICHEEQLSQEIVGCFASGRDEELV